MQRPHLADGQTVTATWEPSAWKLFSKKEVRELVNKWEPEITSIRDRTAPDGTGWRGLYLTSKRLYPHAKNETAILLGGAAR